MEKKIIYDFTKGITDEVALVPASMVNTILSTFVERLVQIMPEEVVAAHAETIRNIAYSTPPDKVIEAAIRQSQEFIETRRFIKIIKDKDYDSTWEQ